MKVSKGIVNNVYNIKISNKYIAVSSVLLLIAVARARAKKSKEEVLFRY
jgi:hypothetical protein